jgi:hypothetical protein
MAPPTTVKEDWYGDGGEGSVDVILPENAVVLQESTQFTRLGAPAGP